MVTLEASTVYILSCLLLIGETKHRLNRHGKVHNRKFLGLKTIALRRHDVTGSRATRNDTHLSKFNSCKDVDSKDKCAYIRQLGFCKAGKIHTSVRKRCADSCGLCDCMNECGGMCGPCQQFIIPAPPLPQAAVSYYPLPLPPSPPPQPPPYAVPPAMPVRPALPACGPGCMKPVYVPQPPALNYEGGCMPCRHHPCIRPTCRPGTATMTRPFSSPCSPAFTPTPGQVLCPPIPTTPSPAFSPVIAARPQRVPFIAKHVTQIEGYTTVSETDPLPVRGATFVGSPSALEGAATLAGSDLGPNLVNRLPGAGAPIELNPSGLNGLPAVGTQVNSLTGELTSTNPLTGATSRVNPLTGEVSTSVGSAFGAASRANPLTGEFTSGMDSARIAGAAARINPLTGQVVPGVNSLLGAEPRVNPVTGEVISGTNALDGGAASAVGAAGPVVTGATQTSSAAVMNPVTGALTPVLPGSLFSGSTDPITGQVTSGLGTGTVVTSATKTASAGIVNPLTGAITPIIPQALSGAFGSVEGLGQSAGILNPSLVGGASGLNTPAIAESIAGNQLLGAQGSQLLPSPLQLLQAQTPSSLQLAGRCRIPADIVLALDSSAATVPHWEKIQNFARQFMDHITMSGYTRIGILQYDSIAKVIARLEQFSNVPDVKMQINRMVPDPFGKRRTDAALETARNNVFQTARQNVPKVLILLEHGKIVVGDPLVDGIELLVQPAQRVHAAGIQTFVIGTTPAATDQDMQIIATNGDSQHIFKLTSYQDLEQTVPLLVSRICALPGILKRGSCRCTKKV